VEFTHAVRSRLPLRHPTRCFEHVYEYTRTL